MLGLVPETLEVVPAGRRRRVPTAVVHELQRLTGLYEGFVRIPRESCHRFHPKVATDSA